MLRSREKERITEEKKNLKIQTNLYIVRSKTLVFF
jgi:hypothetical protein